jgi:hypothetical protein
MRRKHTCDIFGEETLSFTMTAPVVQIGQADMIDLRAVDLAASSEDLDSALTINLCAR